MRLARKALSRAAVGLTFVWLAVLAGNGLVAAAPLSYEDARVTLHTVSDLQKSGESGVSRNQYEARAADSLGLPEVSVNATQVFGLKTGSLETPLGTIDVREDFTGPRSSVNSTWSIYTGGRITATQRALAAGVDQARAELAGTRGASRSRADAGLFRASRSPPMSKRTRTEQLQAGRSASGARHTLRAAGTHRQGGTSQRAGLARRGRARARARAKRSQDRRGTPAATAPSRRPGRAQYPVVRHHRCAEAVAGLAFRCRTPEPDSRGLRRQARAGAAGHRDRGVALEARSVRIRFLQLHQELSDADRAELDRRDRHQLHAVLARGPSEQGQRRARGAAAGSIARGGNPQRHRHGRRDVVSQGRAGARAVRAPRFDARGGAGESAAARARLRRRTGDQSRRQRCAQRGRARRDRARGWPPTSSSLRSRSCWKPPGRPTPFRSTSNAPTSGFAHDNISIPAIKPRSSCDQARSRRARRPRRDRLHHLRLVSRQQARGRAVAGPDRRPLHRHFAQDRRAHRQAARPRRR